MSKEIPPQGLLDFFTRQDELQVKQIELLGKILVAVSGQPVTQVSGIDFKNRLLTGQVIPGTMLGGDKGIDLSVARTDKLFDNLEAVNYTAATDGSLAGVYIRINSPTAPLLPLQYFNPCFAPFYRLYLTNSAQSGKTLYLFMGNESTSSYPYSMGAIIANILSVPALDSTTALLDIAATYTGAQFQTLGYGILIGSCYADHDGTLYVEQSWDGTHYDISQSTPYTGGTAMGFDMAVFAPFARLRYVNGAAAQTIFRLYIGGRGI